MTEFPLFWLVIVTLALVLAFAVWNYVATRRRQKHGRDVEGIGGKNDPLA